MCIEHEHPSGLKPQRGDMCNMRLIDGNLRYEKSDGGTW